MERITLTTEVSKEYQLLDSGREEKLEKYGSLLLSRPDPQALWEKRLSPSRWQAADGRFVRKGKEGEWKTRADFPKEWQITFGGFVFAIRATSFKHTGLFPEQLPNWEWLKEKLQAAKYTEPPKVLNLFGYTGGATLAAASLGAQVTHVDASKVAVTWAKENAKLSGLGEKPIRWIIEDALTFVKREIRRGNTYDGIIMDPPAFGHGPKKELWKIEEDLLELFSLCEQLLPKKPLFLLVSGYAAGYSPLALGYNLARFEKKHGGTVECGDLAIKEAQSERLLPCGIFGRWSSVSTGDTVDSKPLFEVG